MPLNPFGLAMMAILLSLPWSSADKRRLQQKPNFVQEIVQENTADTGPRTPAACQEIRKDPIKDTNAYPEKTTADSVVRPDVCIDFNYGNEGFAKCPSYYDNVQVKHSPNQSWDPTTVGGVAGDSYLHLRDRSGASLGCGTGDEYTGDWNFVCKDSCLELCFDFRVFYDGCNGNNPACTEISAAGISYAPITPRIIIQGGAPNYYRAVLSATFTVTDDDGNKPGWHTVCGRLGPLDSNGDLPSMPDAEWTLAGAPCDILSGSNCGSGLSAPPNDAWCELWSNVAAIQLPIDPTPNPAERFGYDNICVHEIPGCGIICDPEPLCYWKYDMGCQGFKKLERFPEILAKVKYFDNRTCLCEIMQKNCPDRCAMAEQEYLALLLNVASGKLDWQCCVEDCSNGVKNVADSIRLIDSIMSSYPRSDYDCARALALASGINEGALLCKEIK